VTNECDIIGVSSTGSVATATAYLNNSRVIVPNVNEGHLFYASSATVNDHVEIVNTQIGNGITTYPVRYTEAGDLGNVNYFLQHGSGDLLLGGGIDLSASTGSTPNAGHIKLFVNPYAGLEQPYFKDSTSNSLRICRDSVFNGYNSSGSTMPVGTPVYRMAGVSPLATPIVGRCLASNPATMPCAGIVTQVGGITNGGVGRVMFYGRTESYFNTSAFSAGDPLYVSEGFLTNTVPLNGGIKQQVGWVHTGTVNGWMNVHLMPMDTLGGLNPSSYVTYSSPKFNDSVFGLTNSNGAGMAKFSSADVPAGTTNTYILPAVGGTLATYTDIQLVPVSAVVGESGGIVKGRAVYLSGVDVDGRPVVKYADKAYSTHLPVIGVTTVSGALGAIIEVANFGPIYNLDTSIFSDGENIYLGNSGAMTKQSSINTDAIILLGTCGKSDAVNGSMLVNVVPYLMDGAFAGSMRYTVKNASDATNATSVYFAMNSAGEAMRMGVRGTNYFRGTGGFVVNNSGQMMFGNGRRARYVWNIDMTDSGNDYNHINWPMMALVPQSGAESNAFFGVGTTNPLAMLHVNGSAIITNSLTVDRAYRTRVNSFTSTEFVTYGAMTNADTILSTRIDVETNRAIVAEGVLTTNVNTKASTNQLNTVNTNLINVISIETNRAIQAEAGLQTQVNTTTNRVKGLEDRTNVWNTASLPTTKFLANIGTANITYAQATAPVLFTNVVYRYGGTYSNTATVARWIPGVTGVMVRITGAMSVNGASQPVLFQIKLYKNGSLKSTMATRYSASNNDDWAMAFHYVDVTTSATDFYEVYVTSDKAGQATLGSGNDNWWAGEVMR
jgi:hypothetical protein